MWWAWFHPSGSRVLTVRITEFVLCLCAHMHTCTLSLGDYRQKISSLVQSGPGSPVEPVQNQLQRLQGGADASNVPVSSASPPRGRSGPCGSALGLLVQHLWCCRPGTLSGPVPEVLTRAHGCCGTRSRWRLHSFPLIFRRCRLCCRAWLPSARPNLQTWWWRPTDGANATLEKTM